MSRGFTFIELVIVILLIGILAAVFAPRLFRQADSFKVDAAAEQIANHIRLAQSRAIAQHEDHTVDFIPSENRYSVYNEETGTVVENPLKRGTNLNIDFDDDEQLKGVTIEDTTFGEHYVTFNALGKPSDSGGDLTSSRNVLIQKGSNQLYIGIAAETGAVSIW